MHVAELRAVRLGASPADARSVHARPRYQRPSGISSAIFRRGGQDRPNWGNDGLTKVFRFGRRGRCSQRDGGGGMMEHAQQAGITIPPRTDRPAAPPSAEQIIAFPRTITARFFPLLAMTTAKRSQFARVTSTMRRGSGWTEHFDRNGSEPARSGRRVGTPAQLPEAGRRPEGYL